MAKEKYRDYLKREFGGLIDTLQLTDLQRRFMRSRWLDQVLWMEGKAEETRTRYYFFRLLAIVGGVAVPALMSIYLVGGVDSEWRWVPFVISVIVAMSAAVEEFFHYGERWRHYRRMVEWMKIEAWKFFQLADGYSQYKTHELAYTDFAAQIEAILQQDVEGYVSGVAKSPEKTVEKMAAKLSQVDNP